MADLTAQRLASLTAIALEVATEAAAPLLHAYRRVMTASEKGRADLVTEHDVRVEQLIRRRLAERAPGLPIVGEEQGGHAGGATWYCDPIDGTTNFVHGHPFFCVSIGLMESGRALAGAVVAPALGVSWHGFEGGGAQRNGESCRVSDTRTLDRALLATGFHPQSLAQGPPHDNLASFAQVLPRVRGIRRCGSAALDLCMVADGTYDAYWERALNAWDTAGGAAIVLAAGGRITDLSGGPVDLSRGHLVASNGHVHDELLGVLGAGAV